jgi:hypothetical protein
MSLLAESNAALHKSGQREIYIRSFTGKGPEVQMSVNGGVQVRWRRDGNELFCIAAALPGAIMQHSNPTQKTRIFFSRPVT